MMATLFTASDFAFFKSVVVEAGDAALRIQKGTIEVSRKGDASIVTQADLMVQDMLTTRIASRYGGVNFILEENNRGSAGVIDADTVTVIIDPIDGTAMYSMYLPVWCVSVGIFKGYVPLYGFVYSPGFNMLFHNDDEHAYLNGTPKIIDRNMTIDSETNIFYASEVHHDFVIGFPGKIRNLGSTALHACLTIDNERNRTLAFLGKSSLWDWAGAVPIILKAGGDVRYLDGSEIDYRAIIKNNYRFIDYAAAYTANDFTVIRNIFTRR